MVKRMLASGLFAGCAVGLLAALLHFAFVQDYILLGEQYETGALVHFDNATPPPAAEAGHDHAAGTEAHDHAPAAATDGGGDLKRNALTVLFTVLIYTAYAVLLAAGFGLAESFGHRITGREGLIWGLAGFFTFQMAPALGLAPELPGSIAADLGERQVWWWLTVACTGGALALLSFGKHWIAFAIAGAALIAPHVIGAPQPDAYWGVAPPELAATFTARVLGTALIVWAMLGWVTGALWAREGAH